jgi:hypothetical protein
MSVEQVENEAQKNQDLEVIALETPDHVDITSDIYDNRSNLRFLIFTCIYVCLTELSTGILTGLSSSFIIYWVAFKVASYCAMIIGRIRYLRAVYDCAYDLPDFCNTPRKVPPAPSFHHKKHSRLWHA